MASTRPPFASKPAFENLEQIARDIRVEILTLSQLSKTPLPDLSFSCVELLIGLYWNALKTDSRQPDDPARDRFLFSKASGLCALYSVLARRGFFPLEELKQFNKEGCRLALHPAPASVPGLEWIPGAPGKGLGIAIGMALAARLTRKTHRVLVLMDERECPHTSLQSTARTASQLQLSNLIAIVENSPPSESAPPDDLAAQWRNCGWETREIDGHDPLAIGNILKQSPSAGERPLALLALTTKGRGVSLAASDPWKNRPPTADELEAARKELLA